MLPCQYQTHEFGLTRRAGFRKDPMKTGPCRRNLDPKPVRGGLKAAALD
jgi:hypothetical protein